MYSKFTKHKSARFIAAVMLVFIAISGNLRAQLSGTKTIGVDYLTLAAAVTDINLQGVNGALTIDIPAGFTETAPVGGYVLTATGTLANTITFQKSGVGANPLLSAYAGSTLTPGTANQDGVFRLIGSDYVTIDGIDITDPNTTNPSTMEFGYALYKASANDGCQNNTIKNCTITLNRINNATGTTPMVDGSAGIIMMNALSTAATTALTPTVATGANSNNKFYSNTIQNCNIGIALIGYVAPSPFALADTGNDIGGLSTATGNTVVNYGGGGTTNPAAAIRTLAQYGINVSFNTINNNNGSGVNHAFTLRGIYLNTATSANAAITNNTLTIKGGGTSNLVSVIDNASGSTAASNTITITNNVITNCTYSTATTAVFNGIINSGSATSVIINNNLFNNINLAGTGTCVMLETGSPVNAIANSNTITAITRTGASGSFRLIKTSSPSVGFTANNNLIDGVSWTAVASTGSVDGIYGLSSAVNFTTLNNIIKNISVPTTGTINGIREFGSSAGNKIIQGNQIYNFTTTAGGVGGATFNGVFCSTGTIDISNNQIYALNSTGTTGGTGGAVNGIQIAGGTTNNIYKNKIYNLSSGSTGPVVSGIIGAGGTTNNIYNNIIGDLRAPIASAANPVMGINLTSGTTFNVAYNSVYLSATSTGANFGSSSFWAGATPGTVNLNNNIFVNNSTPSGTGIISAIRRAGAILTNYGAASNNNLLYAGTASTVNAIYFDGATTYSTLAAFKTAVGPTREAASVSENPSFASTVGANANFLHFNAATSSVAESGAVNIAGITGDFDADVRQGNAGYAGTGTSPDIGADEFEGTSPAPAINSLSVTPSVTQCTAISRDIFASVSAGVASLVSVTLNYSFNGTAQTPITMVGGNLTGTSTWSATIPTAIPTNAVVSWNVVVTDGTYTKSLNGTTYSDEPVLGSIGTATASANPICQGASTNISGLFTTSVPTPTNYCTAAAGGTTEDDIGQVTFAGINNPATRPTPQQSNPAANGAFTDFTSITGTVARGVSYPATIYHFHSTGDVTANSCNIYIDFNKNGLFTDAGEVFSLTKTGAFLSDFTGNITIPTTAALGLTKMRVVLGEGTITSPCGNVGTWAEVEDYLLNITPNFASYSWTDGTSIVGTTNPLSVSPNSSTSYTLTSTDVNGCSVVSAPVTVSVTPLPSAPIVANTTQCGVGVSSSNVIGGAEYNWYATLTSTVVLQSGASSTYTSPIAATTSFYVTSVNGTCESTPRAEVTTTVSIPDGVLASSSSTNLCVGGSNAITLTATQLGTTNPYTFSWVASPVSGSGMPSSVSGATTSVTPTLPGTYSYSVTATDGICTTVSSVDVTLNNLPVILTANASPTVVCSGETVNFNTPTASPTYSLPPAVSNPLADEDFANITITQGATTILNNTTANNSLVGTIGVATGTVGSYSDFTSFGAYLLIPGQTYSFSASSSTSGTNYNNALAIFIDYNRNGLFTDANELVYTSPATISGAHTRAGSFTVPAGANIGLTRMRVVSNEGLINSPTQAISWGEYEEYTINLNQDITLYTWQWNPGAINGYSASTVVTNTTGIAQTQNFTVTATSTLTGCSNTATVDVVVNPIPTTPIATDALQCGFGVPTASVSGGTSYNWYATPTSTTVLQSGASSNFTTTINSATTWYVSSVSNEGCISPRAAVTQSVTIPDALAATASSTNLCVGGANAITLTAVKTGTSNTYAYTWTAATGSGIAGSVAGTSVSVTPNVAGIYTYTVTGIDGICTNIATVDVTLNALPSITASGTPTVICSGAPVNLNALSINAITSTTTVGTGTTTSSFGGSPFYHGWGGAKVQYIYTAAELTAQGLTIGNITSLGLNVTVAGTAYQFFNLSVGTTTQSVFATANAIPNLTQVYGNAALTPSVGINTFNFATPLYWDGSSNIVVSICWTNVNGGGTSATVQWATYPGFNKGMYIYTDNQPPNTVCGALTTIPGQGGSSTTTGRPLTYFTGAIGTNVTSAMNFVWNPGAIPTNTALVNPVNTSSVSVTQVYTVTVNNPSTTCSNTETVGVLVNPIPTTPVANNGIQCGIGVPNASVTGGTNYEWFASPTSTTVLQADPSPNFLTSIGATTSWYVQSVSVDGCISPRAMLTETVNIPDAITANTSSASICATGTNTIVLSAVNTGTTNTYAYSWTSSPSFGGGITGSVNGTSVSVVPTLPGTYTYSVTGVDGLCVQIATVAVTLNSLPDITSATSTPSAICSGSSFTLNANSIASGPQVVPTGYCVPNSSGGACINLVSINTLNYTSACETGNYLDVPSTSATTNLTPGQSYVFSINTSGSAIASVWFDWNKDGLFDASEWYQPFTTGTSGTANVTVPLNASGGLTKMRVRTRLSGNQNGASDACLSFGSGEAEDYTINLQTDNSASYNWTWNPGPVNSNTLVTSLTNTTATGFTQTYTVSATSSVTGCSNVATVDVVVNPIPATPSVADASQCGLGVPSASVNGGTSYNWYATPTSTLVLQTGASSNFTTSVSNTTSWNVASTNGFCESPRVVVTQTVVAPPALTLNTPAAICGGNGIGTFSVTSNLSDYGSYVWSPTTGLFTDAAATVPYTGANASSLFVQSSSIGVLTYSVVSTNTVTGCGNETTSTITIKESPASITLTAVPNPLCAGSTVSLSATANTFSVAVYNETFNGATNNWITASTSTGGTPASADWAVRVSPYTSGVGTNMTSNDASQFYLTDSDSQGSGSTTGVTLQSPAISTNGLATLDMSFYHYYNQYPGDSALLQVSTNGSSWTTLRNFSTAGVDIGTAQGFVLESVNLNAYVGNSTLYVRYKYDASWGFGWAIDNVKLVGNTDNTYSWTSNPAGFAATTSTVTDVPAVSTTYSVVITNTATSCSNSAAITVSVNPVPVVTAVTSSSAVCGGSSATLTAGGAATYTWSSGATTAVAAVTPTAISVYTVTGAALGCTGTNTVSVDVIALPTIVATAANASVCPSETTTLTASGAASYTWSSGGTTSTELVTVNSASIYTVTGEDLGCTNTTTVAVGLNPIPSVLATASQTLLCDNGSTGSSILTASTSATTYLWSDGATTMTTAVTPTTTTTYTVTVTDVCSAEAYVTITVSNCNGIKDLTSAYIEVYPNPTNGLVNISMPDGIEGSVSVEVFDAIGKLVMKEDLTTNLTTINLAKFEDGMYFFKIIKNNNAIKISKIVKQ
ncbi:MAG: T9SS type A sorting domain-containing protein [Bacteroidia bacterium]|nr:T9SS type A sorting domain-containing protein [Bacteroidia bacterium]